MLAMIVNIYTHRSADQATVEAPDYSNTNYSPPNTKDEDKITFPTPTTPPHKKEADPPALIPQGGDPTLPPPPSVGPACAPVGPAPSSQSSHHCSLPPTSGLLLFSPFNIPLRFLSLLRPGWTAVRTTRWTKVRPLW